VSQAAVKLHVTQPAMTRRLKRLESALGFQLLDRRVKPFRLTPAGREVLERARQVLQSVDALHAASSGAVTGELRVGVALTFAHVALARPLDDVRLRFPRVGLQVTTGWSPALLEALQASALDAAFLALVQPATLPAGVIGTLLGDYPLVGVAPRRAALPRVVALERLGQTAWVLNPEGCGIRRALQRALATAGIPLRVAVEVYGWDLQLSLVARGVGFGVMPAWCVRRHPARSRLQVFRLRDHDIRLGFWSARRPSLQALEPVAEALGAAFATATLALR
jgi:DNA-binding transcriptional LysR family regulator